MKPTKSTKHNYRQVRDPKLLLAATAYATLLLSARSLMSGTMVTRAVTSRVPISDTPLERKRTPKEQCDTVEINLRTRRRRRF